MDAIVSPNQPFKLHAGNLDGFPTGCCVEASLCGVAMIVTDALKQNPGYVDGRDLLLTAPVPEAIVARIAELLADPARIASIGQRGQQVTRRLYAPGLQIGSRHALLKALAGREGCRV
jgi:lipopolysaccharide transport system ATP-binding protein